MPVNRIAVDGFNLALEKGTGVATYGRNLTYCLRDMGREVQVLYGKRAAPGKSRLMQEIAFFDENAGSGGGRLAAILGGMRTGLNPRPREAQQIEFSGAVIYNEFLSRLPHFDELWNSPKLFEHAHLYFRLFGKRLPVRIPAATDIMHWTYPLPLKLLGAKNIYTLHDLVPLRLPYTTLDRKHEYFKLVSRLAKEADHIVTVSETSKADIMTLLGVPAEKITNTYQSVHIPREYLSVPVDILKEELEGGFRLSYKKYLLYYGSIEPKKNISRIIEAYLASNIQIPLVIIGAQSWKAEQELKLLKNLPAAGQEGLAVKRKVIQLDYATFPQLVNLIRGALAITFPSLYEGFGLPILESMICETPIITSNIGSMVEVAGEAGILVDPYSTRQIKEAMIAVATDAQLREEKIERGRAISQLYSPDAYRHRLAGVYNHLLEGEVVTSSSWRSPGR